jgi:hypothetical protein
VVAVDGAVVPLTSQQRLLALLRPPGLRKPGEVVDPFVAARVSASLQAEHAVDAGWPLGPGAA